MTEQARNDGQHGVRERLGGVVHAVQDAVTDRVAPAVDAVASALHEAGHAATHLVSARRQIPAPQPEPGPVPSGTQIVRPARGGATFLAWHDGRWRPVRRQHGSGWVWSA